MAGNFEAVRKEVALTILAVLKNNCAMVQSVDQTYKRYFEGEVKIGDSLDIPRPIRTVATYGQAFQPQGQVRVTVPLTIKYWLQRSMQWNDTEEAMFLRGDMKKSYVIPMAIGMANDVDRLMLNYAASVIPNFVGTPGVVPTTLQTYNSATTALNILLAPSANRSVIINSSYEQNMVGAGSTVFNDQRSISKQYLEGYMGRYSGFDFTRDEQVPQFTVGTYTAPITVNGANQSGAFLSINYSGGAIALTQPGANGQQTGADRITIAGVYKVNPQSLEPYSNQLFQASVINPVNDATGTVTLNIFPPLIPSGPYQNCSGSPAANAVVTIAGASGATCQTAIAMQRGAFTWVPIALQDVNDMGAMSYGMRDPETGIEIRIVKQFDARLGYVALRLDMVWGIASVYSENYASVIYG